MPQSPLQFDISAAAPKAKLLIVHGLAEYANRYRAIADEFAARGISTAAFDLAGHGESAGERTHIERFDEFIGGTTRVFEEVGSQQSHLPLFIWGHSMGAIIALRLVARGLPNLGGLVVSSNSLNVFKRGLNPLNPLFRLASRLAPRIRIPLGLDATKISRDEAVQRAYASDPHIPATASLRLIVEFATACELARVEASSIRVPVLIVHGEQDAIAPASGSQLLFDTVASTDKTLKIYPGLRHEVHNERTADRAMFVELVSNWVLSRARPVR